MLAWTILEGIVFPIEVITDVFLTTEADVKKTDACTEA